MKILVVIGHPQQESLVRALAESYVAGATQGGHEIEILHLSNVNLKPYISYEHGTENPVITPELRSLRKQLVWADHYVFAYPIWWGLPPALLKVYFEVIFAPGVAFKYLPMKGKLERWDKLLEGKSAQLLVTGDAPPWFWKYVRGAADEKALKRSILGFSGVKPIKTQYFGSVKTSTLEQRESWLGKAKSLGLQI